MVSKKNNDSGFEWTAYKDMHELRRPIYEYLVPFEDCDLKGDLFVSDKKIEPRIMHCLFVPHGPITENSLQWGTWHYEELPTNNDFHYPRTLYNVYRTPDEHYRVLKDPEWIPVWAHDVDFLCNLYRELEQLPESPSPQ